MSAETIRFAVEHEDGTVSEYEATRHPDAWRYRRNREYENEPWRFSPIDPAPSDDPERTIFREMFEVEPLWRDLGSPPPEVQSGQWEPVAVIPTRHR